MKNFWIPTARASTAVMLMLCASLTTAQSRTPEDYARGLNVIADFSDRMCKNFTLKGSSQSRISYASAGVEVSGLLKVLLNAKIIAGVRAENLDYVGLLQRDLLSAMSESNNCKERYFNQLLERIFPSKPIVLRHEQTVRMIRTETITPDGKRCIEIQDAGNISFNCTEG